ncbi:Outer membrane lipoprotein omp16 precursor [hydrothermal vent metagenome]|uniref:Outer membrane lipoprotein omp16 n=1 Tax=hydrothermal vent metagenome TaxID=652676 RepID=A0A1W1EHL3_9ZZZZ
MRLTILTIVILLSLTSCGKKSKVTPSNVTNSSETVTINDGGGVSGNSSASYNNNNDDGIDGSSGGFKSIYFEFGRYDITPDMDKRMNNNAFIAKNKGKIKLEGNCDEFGTDEYNFALGLKRANAVKNSLVSKGVTPDIIVLRSLGESSPLCQDTTDKCYAKNRRVDFHIVN